MTSIAVAFAFIGAVILAIGSMGLSTVNSLSGILEMAVPTASYSVFAVFFRPLVT